MPRTAALSRRMRASARTRILDGSMAAFAEKGVHATTMDEVASSAGVSKGLAYRYFRSKDHLVAEAVRNRIAHLFEVGNSLDSSLPPAERLARLFDTLFDHVRAEPDVFRLYLALTLEKATLPATRRAMRSLHTSMERYLDVVRQVFVDLGSDDPDSDAIVFRSALLGIYLRYVRTLEDFPIDQIRARTVALFAARSRGVKKPRRKR